MILDLSNSYKLYFFFFNVTFVEEGFVEPFHRPEGVRGVEYDQTEEIVSETSQTTKDSPSRPSKPLGRGLSLLMQKGLLKH